MLYEETVKFHGHECPGLASGYRMAVAGMQLISSQRSADEEIVCIVENDACGVDAVQVVTGCTFGKGNLIFCDHGKNVYTIFSRKTGKGFRIRFKNENIPQEIRADRKNYLKWLLEADQNEILDITPAVQKLPEEARIRNSVKCDCCGEMAMETRTVVKDGKKLCIPCSDKK